MGINYRNLEITPFEKRHIERVWEKAEKTAAALMPLMYNIGEPKAGKKKILCVVVQSIIICVAHMEQSCSKEAK